MTRSEKNLNAANCLMQARQSGERLEVLPPEWRPVSRMDAYAIQDIQLKELGPIAAWKVGAKDSESELSCAALSITGVFESRSKITNPLHMKIEGVEVELGFVLGADLPAREEPYLEDEVLQAIGYACVAVEIVDSRFKNFSQVDQLSRLADFSSHGMVVYSAQGVECESLNNWERPFAEICIGNSDPISGVSQNPAVDVKRLLVWLANHASQRGAGLRRGQLIITGSCFPMAKGEPGQLVKARVANIEELRIKLPDSSLA